MIVVIMDMFAPVVPFIFATIYLRLLSSLALLVGVSLLPLNAVSAPLVEGEGDHPPGYLAKTLLGWIGWAMCTAKGCPEDTKISVFGEQLFVQPHHWLYPFKAIKWPQQKALRQAALRDVPLPSIWFLFSFVPPACSHKRGSYPGLFFVYYKNADNCPFYHNSILQ